MTMIKDTSLRYGYVSRMLHWGMALLFAAQFLSAAARWALEREHPVREVLWSYHATLGTTLFLLVLLRGAWGLANMTNRPPHSGPIGTAALAGHITIYTLMVIVPGVRLLAAAGSTRGLNYLGVQIFPAREVEIAWTQIASEWHGEMGWILALLVVGHITMAVVWHRIIRKDDVLNRMV